MTDVVSPEVRRVADRFWERLLVLQPTLATVAGDERYDDRLDDPSDAGHAELRRLYEETLAESRVAEGAAASTDDRITLDVVRIFCTLALEQERLHDHLFTTVDQMDGPQALLTQLLQLQSADTPERLDRLIARLESYPAHMAAHIENMRESVRRGLVRPRIVAERTAGQLERILAAGPEASPVATLPAIARDADRERLVRVARDRVLPA